MHVETEAHVYMYIYMQVHIDLIVQDSLTLLNGPLVFSYLDPPPIPPSPHPPPNQDLYHLIVCTTGVASLLSSFCKKIQGA